MTPVVSRPRACPGSAGAVLVLAAVIVVFDPEPVLGNDERPRAARPAAEGPTPGGLAPEGPTPGGPAPEGFAPIGVAPAGVLPEGFAPGDVTAGGFAPERYPAPPPHRYEGP